MKCTKCGNDVAVKPLSEPNKTKEFVIGHGNVVYHYVPEQSEIQGCMVCDTKVEPTRSQASKVSHRFFSDHRAFAFIVKCLEWACVIAFVGVMVVVSGVEGIAVVIFFLALGGLLKR